MTGRRKRASRAATRSTHPSAVLLLVFYSSCCTTMRHMFRPTFILNTPTVGTATPYALCFQPIPLTIIQTNHCPGHTIVYHTRSKANIPTQKRITATANDDDGTDDDSLVRDSRQPSSSSSSTTNAHTSHQAITTRQNGTPNRGLNLLGTASSILPQGIIVTIVSTVWNIIWKILMTELAPQSKNGAYIRPTYISSRPVDDEENTATATVTPASLIRMIHMHNTTTTTTTTSETVPGRTQSPRYHIYVGNPCPWCHRVVLTMNLLQLTNYGDLKIVSLVDNPRQASRGGWILSDIDIVDHHSWKDLRDVYNYYYKNSNTNDDDDDMSKQEYVGRCTAPLLVDTYTKTIVSNESADIVQLLIQYYNTYFQHEEEKHESSQPPNYCYTNLYPEELRDQIDNTTHWIYDTLNNGVYRCGFATSQMAYNEACDDVRRGLHDCNEILSQSTFVCSNTTMTIADVYLLPTLLRYDAVYSPLFKAGGAHNCLRSTDYPHIQRYLQFCWNAIPGIRESINLTQACASYYEQLFPLNPSQIIPYPITAHDLGLE